MEPKEPLSPGDEAEPGTVGAGEGICDNCAGTAVSKTARPAPNAAARAA